MLRYVYDFVEGSKELDGLLGGKGAHLAEMTRMGLPVPPGFTITTEASRDYMRAGAVPPGLFAEIQEHVNLIELRTGRRLGDVRDPLLLSVRAGGKFAMPGIMKTILDVGLSDASVQGLAEQSGDERFAWDSYRRLIQTFGRTVFEIPPEEFEMELNAAKETAGVRADADLSVADLKDLVQAYQKVFLSRTGRDFPQASHEQLFLAVTAIFRSWTASQERIPHLGIAVNVMAMVFGNLADDSGTGVAFTPEPATGRRGVYGRYLPNAQGTDVAAGARDAMSLDELAAIDPQSYRHLVSIMERLEQRYPDLRGIAFTIERGKLWLLQLSCG